MATDTSRATRRTRNRLTALKLDELSLVDRPANPLSVVVITKRMPAPATFRDIYRELSAHVASPNK